MAEYVRYANQGATRNQPLAPGLLSALGYLGDMGLTMEVFSGGQPAAGQGPRVGSTRHDHGNAADVFFYQGDRRLDWANPQDRPIFEEIVRRGRANGITGFGAGDGYMQPGSMHIGFGNEAVWGAGGSGANAPDWLRAAYYGAPAGSAPAMTETVSTMNAPQQPQEPQRQTIWDRLGVLQDPDKRAKLAMALEGMTLRPNEGLIRGLEAEIDGRRQDRRLNATEEWLRSQPGGERFAGLVPSIGGGGAIQAYMQAQQGPEQTSAMQNYQYLVDLGVPPDQAVERAFGGGGTSITVDNIGTIPQGYELYTDPETGSRSMRPIPGGPADTSENDAARGEQAGRAASVVLDDIGAIESIVTNSALPVTGSVGSMLSRIPGTNQYDASKLIQTVRGNIGFDRLQQMRDASPTGGALGAINQTELDTLQSVLGSLDQGQSQDQFLRNLRRLDAIYRDILRKANAYPNAGEFGFGRGTSADMSDDELLRMYGGGN